MPLAPIRAISCGQLPCPEPQAADAAPDRQYAGAGTTRPRTLRVGAWVAERLGGSTPHSAARAARWAGRAGCEHGHRWISVSPDNAYALRRSRSVRPSRNEVRIAAAFDPASKLKCIAGVTSRGIQLCERRERLRRFIESPRSGQ